MQHTATYCNILHQVAIECNRMQHDATRIQSLMPTRFPSVVGSSLQHTATHCNTLQHTATQYTTLHHTAPHYITLRHTAPHCNTTLTSDANTFLKDRELIINGELEDVAVCCSVLQCVAMYRSVLQCVAVYGSVLQCVAMYRSVLQCVAVCCSVLQCVAVMSYR